MTVVTYTSIFLHLLFIFFYPHTSPIFSNTSLISYHRHSNNIATLSSPFSLTLLLLLSPSPIFSLLLLPPPIPSFIPFPISFCFSYSTYLIRCCLFSFLKDTDTGPLTEIRLKTVKTHRDRTLQYLRPCPQLRTVLLKVRS